jgi:DNA modification methylase
MGSGSTVAAGKHFGLESIGLEVNEEYYLMARSAIPKLATLSVSLQSRGNIQGQISTITKTLSKLETSPEGTINLCTSILPALES